MERTRQFRRALRWRAAPAQFAILGGIFTFRNPSEKPQKIFFAGGTFKIWMADADGSMQHDQYNLYSVRGLAPDQCPGSPM
jgi:hypothetical protein